MSHSKLRSEKNCLNCGAQVAGRYCNQCGQENVEPKQSLWHLVVHFFNDFTHFDGKFFSTLRYLLFKPGFLSLEHMKGRRMAYLDPIRMYLFMSALAFLIFFSLVKIPSKEVLRERAKKTANVKKNKGVFGKISASIDKLVDKMPEDTTFTAATVAQYDSLQRALPPSERDNVINRHYSKRSLVFEEKVEKDSYAVMLPAINMFLHAVPQMLFLSLPFFALLLYLVNIRHRREYYYTTHVVFTLHLYCVAFFLMVLTVLAVMVFHIRAKVPLIALLLLFVYLLVAMKRFYHQGWIKTLIKFVLVNIFSLFIVMVLMGIFIMNALFSSAESL